jgi:hypothetical protein
MAVAPEEDHMSLLVLVVLFGLAAGVLAFGVIGPWAGLEFGIGLLGAGLGLVIAVFSGFGALAGGLLIAGLAVAGALFAAMGAVLLMLLMVPLLLVGAFLAGIVPLLLPLAVIAGLVWLVVIASRPAPPPILPAGSVQPATSSRVVAHY